MANSKHSLYIVTVGVADFTVAANIRQKTKPIDAKQLVNHNG